VEEEDIEKLKKERDEYKDKYLRKLAEMDNFRKMLEREKEMEIARCRAEMIREFIEPYENLQRAVESGDIGGVSLVLKQMDKILKSMGLVEIEGKGSRFNPMLHEAVGVVDGEDDGIIVEVYQKGYMLNDMVLRHAKVLVSKKREVSDDGREDNRN